MKKQTSKLKVSEQQIKKAIIDYLALRKDVFCWVNNTGAFKTEKGFYRFGSKGSPDILGIHDCGKLIAIEVKTKKNKLSKEQDVFLMSLQDFGAHVLVAYSVSDVIEATQEWSADDAKGGEEKI